MKLNAATALILHIMMIQGQVLQNLIFHISLQEIQQEILSSSGKKITFLLKVPHSTVMQKEDQEEGVFGIEIRSTAPGLRKPLWNLYLNCGYIHDLIQKIYWHPIPPLCLPTDQLISASVSFHRTIRSHVSPLLLSSSFLSFSLCCISPPHTRQFGSQVFWVGSYNRPFTLGWELHSIQWYIHS